MQKYDVAIVGGGAAGLTCALAIKRKNINISVAVIDSCDRLGKKLAATGNGQGNVSNSNLSRLNYHGSGADMAYQIIGENYKLPTSIFNCLFTCDEEGRMYPSGKQASALVDSLLRELERLNVKLLYPLKVKTINKDFEVVLSDGTWLKADKVVLACGGKAQKQFGTDGSSYGLAQAFGHKLTPLSPSLVQLKTDTSHIRTLKGIRVDCLVTAFCSERNLGSSRGDVIFTDYGVSGNAIFKISSKIACSDNVKLKLCFLPDISEQDIKRDIANKRRLGYPVSEWLSGTLHNQVGRAIIKRCPPDENAIVDMLKNFELNVTGTLGFDYAQVTRGGIDCSQVGCDLQSKLVKGLYLIGEYLDVDGDCGGYNLLWAFASAVRAAESITETL